MVINVRRLVSVTCLYVGAVSLVGPAHLLAGQPVPPAVSVVAFDGQGTSQRDREAMADELAARLVDTRRFRVLPREWLPADRENPDPTMAALFESAKAARIDYLIFGTARQYTTPLRSGPSPLVLAALAMRGRFGGPAAALLFPALSTTTPRVQTILTVHVRVVDVTTEDEVRTVNASRSTRAPAPILAPSPKPKLSRDWTKAIAEIAGTLDVRPAPAGKPAQVRR
jgi:hypothetical protein